ncbi:MATE family efflux transporter [Bacteroidia bacterium]|nr:MATE family efflux transporter [Bacteroidia bacterium]
MNHKYNYSQIFKVAYPIFLTLLVQNLIQVTSTAFLGHVGEVELGASAIAGIFYIVLFMLAFGFSTGSQILIGRRNGEKNFDKIGEIVVHGCLFLFLLALVLFFLTRTFSENILSSLLSSKNVLEAASKYLDWRIYGLFFSVINVMFRAFYVGITNTKVLSFNAILMGSVNVILDYLLIFGNWGFPELGITGAAIASVASEAASVLFFVIYTITTIDLKKYGFTSVCFKNILVIKNILNISLSLMIQYFLSLGTWLFFFLAIEHMGETQLAISNIIRSLYMITSIPIFTFGATTNTLVSNTIGAGEKSEVIPLLWRISRMSLSVIAIIIIPISIFPELALSVYSSNTELINESIPSLYIILTALPLIAVSTVFFNSVSGTGNTRTALFIEVATLGVYISYMWFVTGYLKASLAVCWTTEPLYWGCILLWSFIYMKRGNWQNRKI